VLVRHGFINPTQRGRRREDYTRRERPEPMQLGVERPRLRNNPRESGISEMNQPELHGDSA